MESLEPIWAEGNGFRAMVDCYALEPEPSYRPASPTQAAGVPRRLGCLGLVCARDAVRAILAFCLHNYGQVTLVGAAEAPLHAALAYEEVGWALRLAVLPAEGPVGGGRRTARQGRRTTHGLLLPKTALRLDDPLAPNAFTLVVPSPDDTWPVWDEQTSLVPPPDAARVYAAFGQQLQARVAPPLHPVWMAALWRGLAEARQIDRMVGRGPQVFRCRVPPDRLAALIEAGCRSGAWVGLVDQANGATAVMAPALPPPLITPP